MTTQRDRREPYSLAELLEVVAREFLQRGYDATSMEDLARATGRTKSSLYHHVSGKEELLRLAVARAVDALFGILDEPGAQQGRAVDRLEHVVRGSVRVLAAELPYVTLLLRVRGNTGAERWALERRREFDRRLTLLVRDAVADGDLRADLDPRLVTRLLFGTVNSLVDWFRPGSHSRRQVEDALVTLVLDGLRQR
ncbi:MAG: putative TetR family transcriptional regulator [Frankiales bacterium]|nr:putative TetR family transcriptional regulator [Frankiales bacterium]